MWYSNQQNCVVFILHNGTVLQLWPLGNTLMQIMIAVHFLKWVLAQNSNNSLYFLPEGHLG